MKEEWRPVVGFEGHYEVSNLGRVRSIDRYVSVSSRWEKPYKRIFKGKMLSAWGGFKGNPYPAVHLNKHGLKRVQVHRLVAQAFLADWDNERDVHHKDHNKMNPRVDNLEMLTKRQNTQKFYLNGNSKRIKLTVDMVREIKRERPSPDKHTAAKYGVSKTAIRNILENRTWFYV